MRKTHRATTRLHLLYRHFCGNICYISCSYVHHTWSIFWHSSERPFGASYTKMAQIWHPYTKNVKILLRWPKFGKKWPKFTPPPTPIHWPPYTKYRVFETPLYKKWHFKDPLYKKCHFRDPPVEKYWHSPPLPHL